MPRLPLASCRGCSKISIAMNTFLKHFSAAACAAVCLASYSSASEGWGTDFEQGLSTAAAEGRTALVEFTGSDWCPPCMYVRSKILPTAEFKEFVKKNNLVLVELDFPRAPGKVTPEQSSKNEALAQTYRIEGFPTMLVVDGQGHPYAKIVGGDRSAEQYIARLQKALDNKAAFDAKLKEVEGLSGSARAEGLVAALHLLPENCRDLRNDLIEDIINNDPNDTTGIKKDAEQKKLMDFQLEEFGNIINKSAQEAKNEGGGVDQEKAMVAAREGALDMLKREELVPAVRLIVNSFVGQSYIMQNQFQEGLNYIEKAIASDPENPEMPKLQRLREQLQAQIAKEK